jgi:putative membrane protein
VHSYFYSRKRVGTLLIVSRCQTMSSPDPDTADRRTHLAEDRTILANERTVAGWMRSSLACIAIGVGFHAIFSKVDPIWLPRLIATAFLALGVFVIWLAERRAAAVIAKLDPHTIVAARRMNLRLFAGTVTLGAFGLAVAIWTMRAD